MLRSPFDEPNERSPNSEVRRTPWWRARLVVLAVPLFVLVWARELLELSYGSAIGLAMTWLAVWVAWTMIPGEPVDSAPSLEGTSPSAKEARRKLRAGRVVFILRCAACVALAAGAIKSVSAFWTVMLRRETFAYPWEFTLRELTGGLFHCLPPFVLDLAMAAGLLGLAEAVAALNRIEGRLAAAEPRADDAHVLAPGGVSSSATIVKVDDE